MGETWVELKEFPGQFISDLGRVKGKTGVIRKQNSLGGCMRITLYLDTKQTTTVSVARLVYTAFIGGIPDKMAVMHLDGDNSNNSMANLALREQGSWVKGSGQLSNRNIENIFELRGTGRTQKELATLYSVSIGSIVAVLQRRTYTHVPISEMLIKKAQEVSLARTVLTLEKAREIRSAFATGVSKKHLAAEHSITLSHVYNIIDNRVWKDTK